MADIVFVLTAAAFFALCTGYIRGCERIIGEGPAGAGDRGTPVETP
ncbi:hypothetical protein GCM10027570_40530 [Streptomonospora sediminis]